MQHQGLIQGGEADPAGRADGLVDGARRADRHRQRLDRGGQQGRRGKGFRRAQFTQQGGLDAFDTGPSAQVVGQRIAAARPGQVGSQALDTAPRRQVEGQRGMAVARQDIAQGCRQGVDQAALDAGGGNVEFALPGLAGKAGNHRLHWLAGETLAEIRRPGDIEAAVGRLERRHVDAGIAQHRHPGTV